jgi:hypothetical protein
MLMRDLTWPNMTKPNVSSHENEDWILTSLCWGEVTVAMISNQLAGPVESRVFSVIEDKLVVSPKEIY